MGKGAMLVNAPVPALPGAAWNSFAAEAVPSPDPENSWQRRPRLVAAKQERNVTVPVSTAIAAPALRNENTAMVSTPGRFAPGIGYTNQVAGVKRRETA